MKNDGGNKFRNFNLSYVYPFFLDTSDTLVITLPPLSTISEERIERETERERIDREKSGARSGRGEMMIQRTTNPIAGSGPIPDGRRVSRFQTTTTAASLPLSPVFSSKKAARARKESGNIPRLFLRPGWRDLKTIAVVGRELHRLKMAWKKDREREREASGRGPRSLTGQYQWTAKLVFAWDYIYSVGSSALMFHV